MSITKDDIRAAVASGTISEAQAASVIALAESRQGYRENIEGLDEPFELFRGFNEVFIVVGLTILYTGWIGFAGLSLFKGSSNISHAMMALIGMGAIALLAQYFTTKRRMVAPSITLSMMFGLSSIHLGYALFGDMFATDDGAFAAVAATSTIAMYGFWYLFRVPFAMLQIAVGVFTTCFAFMVLGGGDLNHPRELFLLSAQGPFSIMTFVLGLIGLGIALRFDMSDPHRVTRRSANGFWLHVIAAPAIVNTVALTLFQSGHAMSSLLLIIFLTVMALFAVAIDRRSFLISGIGYVVALAVTVIEGPTFLLILLLGAGLVLLGAKWEGLRCWLMNKLPIFRGKDKLPPWEKKQGAA